MGILADDDDDDDDYEEEEEEEDDDDDDDDDDGDVAAAVVVVAAADDDDDTNISNCVRRVVVVVLMGLAVAWIPIMSANQGDELWKYWQMLISALAPPWAMVFIFGVFWKRTTEPVRSLGPVVGRATKQ